MHNATANIIKETENYKHINEVIQEGSIGVKIALIQNFRELMELMIRSVFEDEINEKVGKRYKHDKQKQQIYRWGSNPGSVRIGEEKVEIQVPRLRDESTQQEVPLKSYNQLKDAEPDYERLFNGMLHGLSTRDYHKVVSQFEDGYGLSRSKVSEIFVEKSAKQVEAFFNRDLSVYDFTALFLDGKYLAKEQIVIALGITVEGKKVLLGFIQTTTENSLSIKELLTSIIERGFKYDNGILCVIDGSKGLRKAVVDTFGDYAVIKRCAWHKRENLLSYFSDSRKEEYKKKFDRAYAKTDFQAARNAFIDLSEELKKVNISASNSILEGLDEVLTLHRLELIEDFGKSFSTTNIIENINSLVTKFTRNVKYWQNSDQRFRWIGSALLEIETRIKRVHNAANLHLMIEKIENEVKNKIKYKIIEES